MFITAEDIARARMRIAAQRATQEQEAIALPVIMEDDSVHSIMQQVTMCSDPACDCHAIDGDILDEYCWEHGPSSAGLGGWTCRHPSHHSE